MANCDGLKTFLDMFQVLCIICRRVHVKNYAVIGCAHPFYVLMVQKLVLSPS